MRRLSFHLKTGAPSGTSPPRAWAGVLVACAALLLGTSSSGCNAPRYADCEVRCNESEVCPSGLECGPDRHCYRDPQSAGSCAVEPDASGAQNPDADTGQASDATAGDQADAALDGGVFSIRWTLRRGGGPVTCAEVGAVSIVISSTPADGSGSYEDLLECPADRAQSEASTDTLPFGDYTVEVVLLDGALAPVSETLTTSGTIQGSDNDLGNFEFVFD
jgi:hypothetical protein